MANDALYVYGIVKSEPNPDWTTEGLDRKKVYTLNEGDYTVLVHNCQEKPYTAEDPHNVKELIIAHNKVLDKAMEVFGGIIPLPFNTIVKKNPSSALANLKKWIDMNKEDLEKKWCRIQNKKEYGIRVYYKKDEIMQKAVSSPEIQELKKNLKRGSQGLNYLLQGKIKSKTNEIVQNVINHFKQKIYNNVKKITSELKISPSSILVDETKDLLVNLSILVGKQQINEIEKVFSNNSENDLSFQLAGPFAPYSFV